MPGIARNTDPISDGDKCANGVATVTADNLPVVIKSNPSQGLDGPPAAAKVASTNVFKLDTAGSSLPAFGVVRVGDEYLPHPSPPPHSGRKVASGSQTVFVNSAGGVSYILDVTPTNTTYDNDLVSPNYGTYQPITDPVATPKNGSALDNFSFENDDSDQAPPPQVPPFYAQGAPNGAPAPIDNDPTQPPHNQPPAHTCAGVESLPPTFKWTDDTGGDGSNGAFDSWAQGFVLSANFTVYDLTVGPSVSTYRFLTTTTQPIGLSTKQILQNMCFHAATVLEPLRSLYGPFNITSGWRNASNNSQHNKGQATDIQYPGFTAQNYWDRAFLVRDNVNYDQMILEYGGKNPWFHLSTNNSGQRRVVLTQVSAPSTYQSGLIRVV